VSSFNGESAIAFGKLFDANKGVGFVRLNAVIGQYDGLRANCQGFGFMVAMRASRRGVFFIKISQRLLVDSLVGGGDEAFEKWVRLMRFAVEFRVELARDEEGMFRYFDDFDQFAVRCVAAEGETGFFEFFAVGIVEFVAMAVPFVDDESAVETGRFGADGELAGLGAQSHGAALFRNAGLLIEHRDDGMRRVGIEFG